MRKSEKKLPYRERIRLKVERKNKEINQVSLMIFLPVLFAILTFICTALIGYKLFRENVPEYYLMLELCLVFLISSLSGFIQIRKRVTVDPPFYIYKGKTAIIVGWIWIVVCFLSVMIFLSLFIFERS